MTTSISLIGSVVIGVIAGWRAGRLMIGNGFGLLGDIIAAVLAAVVGGYVLGIAGMDLVGGLAGRVIFSCIAAAVVLFLVHAFTGRRDEHRMWS